MRYSGSSDIIALVPDGPNGDIGTFKEGITTSMGHTSTFSMGNDAADVNNDGWQDILTLDMRPKEEEIDMKGCCLKP